MRTKIYSEEDLRAFRLMEKRVENPKARWLKKPRGKPVHRQRNFNVSGEEEKKAFLIYQRQNLEDESDFSCGISYLPRGALPLTLARYNGPSHVHGEIIYRPHIHLASENAIRSGRKAEAYATVTNRFESLEGALSCLVEDYNVAGLIAQPDAPRLL